MYPADHMNKLYGVSVLIADASDDFVHFLIRVSFEMMEKKEKR